MNVLIDKWNEQVIKYEEKNAIFYKGVFYTYRDVDRLSNAVADKIDKMSDKKLIGVMMENSVEYVISILGVLKSERGYVPIDRTIPITRKEKFIYESKIDTILIKSEEDQIDTIDINYILINKEEKEKYSSTNISNELAYVLFTSGTTGCPKGIMVGHNSVLNLINWFHETYNINQNHNIIQLANNSFDVSVEEIFGCIFNGGILFIAEESIRSHKTKLRKFIDDYKINIVQVVPTILNEFFANDVKLESINILICGGEALGNELKNKILDLGYNLYNHYGPTETTVDAARSICKKDTDVTLGFPIKNCKCHILDVEGKLRDTNADGELCVSGINLAIGYLNNEELTNEKFIFFDNNRVYKTGDKARINLNGEIEYLGRIDNQVKLNGLRIELDEIDSYFMKIDGVNLSSTILVDSASNTKLVTFYSSDNELIYSEIIKVLSKILPAYMIPSKIIKVENFELDNNGKISKAGMEKIYRKKYCKSNLDVNSQVSEESISNEDIDPTLLQVRNIVSKICEGKAILNFDIPLNEIGLDSLGYVRLIVELEDEFDIEFDDDKLTISEFKSLRSLAEYVNSEVASL